MFPLDCTSFSPYFVSSHRSDSGSFFGASFESFPGSFFRPLDLVLASYQTLFCQLPLHVYLWFSTCLLCAATITCTSSCPQLLFFSFIGLTLLHLSIHPVSHELWSTCSLDWSSCCRSPSALRIISSCALDWPSLTGITSSASIYVNISVWTMIDEVFENFSFSSFSSRLFYLLN